jgi:hypothetical protein
VIMVLATMSPLPADLSTFPSLWLATLIVALGWQQPRLR